MDVHLARTAHVEGDGTALSFVVESNDFTIGVILVHARKRTDVLAILRNDDVVGRAIAAERYCYSGLRTNEQVNLVLARESPTMLAVVPIELVTRRIEGLVVLSIEQLVGQIEIILLMGACHLNLSLDSVELGVSGDDVLSGKLLAQNSCLEPAASLVAILCCCSLVDVISKRTDGSIFLDSLCSQYATVNTDVLQLVVRLEDDVQHVVHLGLASSHRDGDGAGIVLLVVSNLANCTGLCGNVGQWVLAAYHSFSFRQFQCSFILLAKYVLNIIKVAVDLERCQYGNILLGTSKGTLDDDVCQTQLLARLQLVEIELQTASAFARCGAGDVVVLDSVLTGVVTLRRNSLFQFDSCSVRILPIDINQTIVGTETVGLESYLRRCEGETRFRCEEEADNVVISQIVVMLSRRCQTCLFCIDVSLAVLDGPVAAHDDLA